MPPTSLLPSFMRILITERYTEKPETGYVDGWLSMRMSRLRVRDDRCLSMPVFLARDERNKRDGMVIISVFRTFIILDNCSTGVATSINNAGVANASSLGGHTPEADIAGFSALLLLSGDLLIELFT
ncbi:hypothetical protein Tco_0746860 [Tanacetum coccineum]